MNNKVNVLIFPAGAELALEIYYSLRFNLHVEVFGASGKSDHAKYVYDKNHYFEGNYYINAPDFVEKFNQLIDRGNIHFIIPTHDTVALFLAQHREKINAIIVTSSYQAACIAREKKLTYSLFNEYSFCPKVYEYPFSEAIYPVFLKPNIGQGAKETCVVSSKEELFSITNQKSGLIACEYLPGEELSVDCFSNRNRDLLFVGPRTRERVQMGISFHSSPVQLTSEIRFIADTINKMVNIRGAWFFQIKKDQNGIFKLIEFAVRQATTMGLYRQLGVNFALLSIFDAMNMDVKILKNNIEIELDRSLMSRYKLQLEYDNVYIDFDDTIVINDKVNGEAIRYLYACKNNNIKIHLLTKHKLDLDQSLSKYCLSKTLFDEIILIGEHEDKTKYINPSKSIFIDNYFFDREKVSRTLNVPVFDVDAIECL